MWPGKSLGSFMGSKGLGNEFFGMDGWMGGWVLRTGKGIESYESLAVLREALQDSPNFHSFTQTGQPTGFLGENSSVSSSLCNRSAHCTDGNRRKWLNLA